MNKKIEKYLLDINGTIRDAIRVIDKGALGLAFVIDAGGELHGVVTDGDIRRVLLRGASVYDPVRKAVNKKFVAARQHEDYTKALKKVSSEIRVVPIIDDNRRVVDFIKLDKNIHVPVATPFLKGNEFAYLTDAFLSTWISSSGEYINRFEKEFASFCGAKYGLTVSNGTVALHLALVSLGIGKGDEVIIPDLTFAAPANAVLHTGARPVIVDVESDSWTIDPAQIRKAITAKTKAIIPVHVYGQPCNMTEIRKIAQEKNLYIIEDCAEAHGASLKNKKVGSLGDIGCFSFFANKVLTTGEGGMCLTNSEAVFKRMKQLRDHGMSPSKKYWHEAVGYNYRMTNLQAAIGCAQLERIEQTLASRSLLEKKYRQHLGDVPGVEFQKHIPGRNKITWLVTMLAAPEKRDSILDELSRNNIDSRPFFYSLGSMPLYRKYSFSNKNSLQISQRGLNLPTQEKVNESDIIRIKKVLNSII